MPLHLLIVGNTVDVRYEWSTGGIRNPITVPAIGWEPFKKTPLLDIADRLTLRVCNEDKGVALNVTLFIH